MKVEALRHHFMGGAARFVAAWNVVSSICLVIVNKWIFSSSETITAVGLTAVHFLVTTIAVRFAGTMRVFPIVPVAYRSAVMVGLGRALSVVCMNANLMLNTISLYQLSKIAVLPVVIVAKSCQAQPLSLEKTIACLLTTMGIGVATISHPTLTLSGSLVALAAVLSTVVAVLTGESMVKGLGLSSLQMMYIEMPISTLLVFFAMPFFEDTRRLRDTIVEMEAPVAIAIGLSTIGAICVNVSGFMTVTRLSAIGYLMCGHLKTTLLLVWGLWLESNAPTELYVGSAMALLGLWRYFHADAASKTETGRTEKKVA